MKRAFGEFHKFHILAQRANETVSVFGHIVVLAHAFNKLFSKTKYPVIRAL